MDIQISDYVDVQARALALGYNAPTGLTILPSNFNTAASPEELVHESTTPTIRSLLRQAGIQETRLEKEGEKIPHSAKESWEWVAPILFISQWMLTNAALPTTINLISNYIYDIARGHRNDAQVTFEYVVETIEKTKRGEKREYNCITIKGTPNQLKEFDVNTLKQLTEHSDAEYGASFMDEVESLSEERAAFQNEFNETVDACQKFCYITRAREFQVEARDKLLPLQANAKQLKQSAIAGEYEDAANALLSFEEMTTALINELSMWIALKDDEPAAAWDFLVDAQTATIDAMRAHSLADHLEGYSLHLSALEKHLFPHHGFMSIGGIVRKSECSICGQEFGECDHLKCKPYMGQICYERVTEYELEEASIVVNPGNKHCRIFSVTDDEGVMRDTFTWRVDPRSSSPPDEV